MAAQSTSIAIFGRLTRLSRARVTMRLATSGVRPCRAITRGVTLAVLGHEGIHLLRSGKLEALIAKADQHNVPLISENELLRRYGLLPASAGEPRPYAVEEVAAKSGLPVPLLRILALFDVIEPEGDRYSFRDVKAARDIARLLSLHRDPVAVVAEALILRESASFRRHLAELPLGGDRPEQTGQLDLGDEPASFDDLWESALAAQRRHDHAEAAEVYRRCVAIRPRDAQCLYKLASALVELGEEEEALPLLQKAVTLKPDHADALFELALLSRGRERMRLLQRVLDADPDHIAAVHRLAALHTEAEQYDDARPLWERFLALASSRAAPPIDPRTRDHAKKALLLCRMVRLRAEAGGSKS